MIRPTSLILAIGVSIASTNSYTFYQTDLFATVWLLLLLVVLPGGALLIASLLRKVQNSVPLLTTTVLLCWLVAVFQFHWLGAIRLYSDNLVLLDECISVVPPIFFLLVLWWISSPIQSKKTWVFYKVRADVLPILFIVFVVLALQETESHVGSFGWYWLGIFVLFYVCSPYLFLFLLPTKRMRITSLQKKLQDLARHAGVPNVEIKEMYTADQSANALAFGLQFQKKIVLFTDKLLRNLTEREVLSVARHEFAHLAFKHLTFLWLTLVTVLLWVYYFFAVFEIHEQNIGSRLLGWGVALGAFVIVSRMFEKQADTFAVADTSKDAGKQVIDEESANSMCRMFDALLFVHGTHENRFDLLHGSMAKRKKYLRELVGNPIDSLPINTRVWLWQCLSYSQDINFV